LEPVYHLRAERCELCSQMVDHRTVHARRVRSGTWVEPGICRKRRPSLVDTVALASCPFMHAFHRLAINAATMILAGPATNSGKSHLQKSSTPTQVPASRLDVATMFEGFELFGIGLRPARSSRSSEGRFTTRSSRSCAT